MCRLLSGIGQRDRQVHRSVLYDEARKLGAAVESLKASKEVDEAGGGFVLEAKAAGLGDMLFHMRLSRSRGAEVVADLGRKVVGFLPPWVVPVEGE